MIQDNLFPPESPWTMPTELPDQLDGDLIAVDTETNDPFLKTKGAGWAFSGAGHIAGVSLATQGGTKIYIPIGHETGQNFGKNMTFKWLKHVLKGKDVVFAQAQYDLGWFRREGLDLLSVVREVHDVLIMAPLIDENRYNYSLDALCKDYIGSGKDEKLLLEAAQTYLGMKKKTDVKANMWRLSPQYVGPYAEADAVETLKLYNHFTGLIHEQNLGNIYQLERDLIPILIEMRWKGIRVDLDRARQIMKGFRAKEKAALHELKKLTGKDVDQWVATSCAIAFDSAGLKYGRTEKTDEPSFTVDFLETVDHPIAEQILIARKFQRAHSTFVTNAIFDKEHQGRIHPSFNQLKSDDKGTITGRFSCSTPNLQQAPAKDPEVGPLVRSCFLPEEGEQWASIDYSSQEPRLTVHFAYRIKARGSTEARDKYCNDPSTDYHQMVADMCGIERKPAKAINLGIAYGMQGASLCRHLGLPTKVIVNERTGWTYEAAGDEGQKLLDLYGKKIPFIKILDDACQKQARQNGYVRTILGRRCRFPVDGAGKMTKIYRALNKLIQGSAGDQTKQSILDCYRETGKIPLLTMHDENGFSVSSKEEAQQLGKIMENSVPLEVPSIADIEMGKSWGDSMS